MGVCELLQGGDGGGFGNKGNKGNKMMSLVRAAG